MTRKFVNIFFRARDAHLSDMDILRTMRDCIAHGCASITPYPVMQKQGGCYSIKVNGIFDDHQDVYSAADRAVYVWIRDLPSRGLPFDRRYVFSMR